MNRHALHSDFFQSRDMLAGRRALSVAVAKHAANLQATTEAQIANLDAQIAIAPGQKVPAVRLALNPAVTFNRVKALMLLTQDPHASEVTSITPDAVLRMVDTLGIILSSAGKTADAEPEYHLVWIAVEALRAPLPPLWRQTADGFEHSVTKETLKQHPLLPVYLEHVQHQRRRKRDNRPFASLERFMLFTNPDSETVDGGDFIFFNLETRQSLPGRRIPAEAVAEQMRKRPPPPPPKKKIDRGTAASKAGAVKDASKTDGKQAPSNDMPAVAKMPGLGKDELDKLRKQAVPIRKSALSLRPRSLPEILVAARMLGVDLVSDPSLVWLVDLCLACDYVPCGWELVPKEQMAEHVPVVRGEGLSSLNGIFSEGNLQDPGNVDWLPPMERLWHLAMTGAPPNQFAHQVCDLTTERHPLQGFVRHVLGSPDT